jgi:hypothetical protein
LDEAVSSPLFIVFTVIGGFISFVLMALEEQTKQSVIGISNSIKIACRKFVPNLLYEVAVLNRQAITMKEINKDIVEETSNRLLGLCKTIRQPINV